MRELIWEGISVRDQRIFPSILVPNRFVVEQCAIDGNGVTVGVCSAAEGCAYPGWGAVSGRVQSQYWPHAADLSLAGKRVNLPVMIRRFWCDWGVVRPCPTSDLMGQIG